MLAEIFVLRLEAILRSNALASTSSDIRFVPVKPSIGPGKGKLVQFFFLIPHKLHDSVGEGFLGLSAGIGRYL